ncbi:MAG: hypothetical protein MJ224_01665 [archaeon]|nr:hypothetical protein [archaeon]
MNELKKLTPFKSYCLQNFPFIEEDFDAITNYELLCKIVEYVKAIGSSQNEIINWFNNLDVQDEVNNKLDKMVETGELESILTNYLFKKQTGTIVLKNIYRDVNEYISDITNESETNPIKGYFQGMVTTPTSIIYAVQPNGFYENKLNYVYLVEVSKSNGNIIKESYLELYHCNSIAYNDDKKELYIATVVKYENNQTLQNNDIIIVDYNDFTIKETITLPSAITGIDELLSVSYDNKNNVLAIGGKKHLFIMNDFNNVNKVITLNDNFNNDINPYTNNKYILQELKLYNNIIYRLTAKGLMLYNINGNNFQNLFSFETDIPLLLGEIESIAIEENGDIYLNSVQVYHMKGYNERMFDRTIFKTNIFKNEIKNFEYETLIANDIVVYVKPSTNNHLMYGTNLYPFKHIGQAIMFSDSVKKDKIRIVLQDDTNYGFLICRNNKCITITPSTNASLYCLYIDGNNRIEFNGINFDFSNDLLVDNENNKNCYLEFGNTVFNNCNFTSSNKNDKCITSFHNKTSLNYCNFNNFENALYNKNMSTIDIIGGNWTNITNRFYNEGHVIINFDNTQIYNNCNSDGVLPTNKTVYQYLTYTYANNNVTVNNMPNAKIINNYFKCSIHLNTDNQNFYFMIPLKTGGSRYVVESVVGNYIYKIIYNQSYNNGIFTITPTIYKIDVNANSISKIDNYTQEVTSLTTE